MVVGLLLMKLYHHVTDRQTDRRTGPYRAEQIWHAVKKTW